MSLKYGGEKALTKHGALIECSEEERKEAYRIVAELRSIYDKIDDDSDVDDDEAKLKHDVLVWILKDINPTSTYLAYREMQNYLD